jgi:hypothetical protein
MRRQFENRGMGARCKHVSSITNASAKYKFDYPNTHTGSRPKMRQWATLPATPPSAYTHIHTVNPPPPPRLQPCLPWLAHITHMWNSFDVFTNLIGGMQVNVYKHQYVL